MDCSAQLPPMSAPVSGASGSSRSGASLESGTAVPAVNPKITGPGPVAVAVFDLGGRKGAVVVVVPKKSHVIPRSPAVTRDIALLAPLGLAHERIATPLPGANDPLLAGVQLLDVFTDPTGAKIPA